MLLLVGLGNPGEAHARQRHNVGFMAVERIARRLDFGQPRKRFHGVTAEGRVEGIDVVALKPATYMNESGRSVAAAVSFFKLPLENVLVMHDDLDLLPGKIRVKRGGGHGGHNGLRDIDAHLGPDYRRLRIGIGHPGGPELVTYYVLHDFAKADAAWLDPLLDAVAENFPLLAAGDDARFLNRVTLATQPDK